MGKRLRGKECGKGICQRKDGLYHARFVDKAGKRHEKYFQTIPEARNWIEQAKYADKHEDVFVPSDTTVDAWFSFWIENIVGDLAPNTLRNYRERYKQNIQPIIGKMLLSELLGHASIKTTMDRYVHVTSESLDQAVRQFESGRVSWHISPCENGVKMA